MQSSINNVLSNNKACKYKKNVMVACFQESITQQNVLSTLPSAGDGFNIAKA